MPPANNSSEAIQRISLKNREYAYIEDANRGVVLVVRNPVVRADGRVAVPNEKVLIHKEIAALSLG